MILAGMISAIEAADRIPLSQKQKSNGRDQLNWGLYRPVSLGYWFFQVDLLTILSSNMQFTCYCICAYVSNSLGNFQIT